MKVCTDACLFGAIISNDSTKFKKALDIGTGTGLLSLMLAQKHKDSKIDAVEINKEAFEQAKDNVEASISKSQISVHLDDILNFAKTSKTTYDIIFSNPPFYANDLKSGDEERNLAMHSSALNFNDLLHVVNILLEDEGVFYLLIPFATETHLLQLSEKLKLFPQEIIRLKQTNFHQFFRTVICLTRVKLECRYSEISIKDDLNNYTPEFKLLLKDYYLYL